MEKRVSIIFEILAFVYFFIGVVGGLLIKYIPLGPEFLVIASTIYMFVYIGSPIIYLIIGCLLYKHRNFIMNIIDSVLCYCLTAFGPFPIYLNIYFFNKYLYYLLGLFFSFLPLIFCIFDKTKIEFVHVLKIITRIFMIAVMVLIVLLLGSCAPTMS